MKNLNLPQRRALALAAATVVASGLFVATYLPGGQATAETTTAADKVAIAASDLQVMNQNQQPNSNRETTVKLLSTRFNTSTPTDLIMTASAECALYTAVGAVGGGKDSRSTSTATGMVTFWLALDGEPVRTTLKDPYFFGDANATPPTTGNGPVVFCGREQNMSTANLGPDETITLYDNTREASAFTWYALNIGNGSHTLELFASLVANTACGGSGGATGCATITYTTPAASAIVGQRTLTVDPVHLQNSATF